MSVEKLTRASRGDKGIEATRQPGNNRGPRRLRSSLRILCAALLVMATAGCSRESLQVALAAQQRADQVQQAVFDRQHDGLRVLLYRDLRRKLDLEGDPLNEAQQAALNDAWNERDLIEFWMTQFERAKALRLAGVDAKLYSDQSVVDLLIKSLEAKAGRGEQAIAAWAGERVAEEAAAVNDGPDSETDGDSATK